MHIITKQISKNKKKKQKNKTKKQNKTKQKKKKQKKKKQNKTISISIKTTFSLRVTSSYGSTPKLPCPKHSPNTTLTPQSQSSQSFRPKYPTNCNNYQFDLLINIYFLYPLPNIINRGPHPHHSKERNVSTSC